VSALKEDDIRAVLNEIVDPCSRAAGDPLGLDEMGLVDRVEVTATALNVELLPTSPLCLMAGVFLSEARARLAPLAGARTVNVTLAPRVDWTPARIKRLRNVSR
jgi:metal-sulfur cluster biosynthetic enzyme